MVKFDSNPSAPFYARSISRRFRWVALATLGLGCTDPSPAEETIANDVPPPSSQDYALSFDGDDDYATMGTARCPLPTLAQTISLWISPRATGKIGDLVTLRRDDSGNEFGLNANGAPTMWRIWGPLALAESSEALEPNRWHHIAYVYDTQTNAIYVNGVLSASSTNTPNNRSPTSGWLGSFDGKQRFFAGQMDEVRIWAVARSPAELRAEIDGDRSTKDPDLLAYFSFDEVGGARVYDRSGNGNHVTLGDGFAAFAPQRIESGRP